MLTLLEGLSDEQVLMFINEIIKDTLDVRFNGAHYAFIAMNVSPNRLKDAVMTSLPTDESVIGLLESAIKGLRKINDI